jgi:cytochrome c biogenesis protein CcmG/thiol:disulfide interchange protein DsbE
MLKRLAPLWLLLLSIPLVAGCQLNQPAHAANAWVPTGDQVGQRAPDFDLLSVGDGRSIRLADLRGKPVIVNFYCGCNFCSMVAHEWVRNRDKVGDTAVVAVMTNHWTYNPAAVRDFRKRTGWSWPALADLGSETAKDYNALTCPRLFAIDSQGIIRYTNAQGGSDEKKLVADALAAIRGR